MNAAQRRKFNRKKLYKNEDIVYLVIRVFGEAVAVTKYVTSTHQVYISDIMLNNKILMPYYELTISNVPKAEYETLIEFGMPFVKIDADRVIRLDG